MPASISQASAALKTKLETITGLRAFDFQPDALLTAPLVYCTIESVEYHNAMGNRAVYNYTIQIVLGRTVDRVAQALMDEYASPSGAKSVLAALSQDLTLGGVVESLSVDRSASIMPLNQGEVTYVSLDFTVRVFP